jgi:Fic family protein
MGHRKEYVPNEVDRNEIVHLSDQQARDRSWLAASRRLLSPPERRARRWGLGGLDGLLPRLLPRHALVSVASVMKLLETSKPTAARAIDALEAAGVLIETTGKKRDRWYAYQRYLDRLQVGTDLAVHVRSST